MSSSVVGRQALSRSQKWKRWEPLTGIAFVICFVGSVGASSPPTAKASDKDWLAAYAGQGNQLQHVATGFLLLYAGLFLMSFLTGLWTRIRTRQPGVSPIPLIAAGVSASCFAVGGILMAGISGSMLIGSMPEPGVDLLRLGNGLGFAMVGVAGMTAAAVSIACLSVQAHSVGLFGRGFLIFGLVVAVLLLGALAFFPIVALLIWMIVVSVVSIRGRNTAIANTSVSPLVS
jgi:hypothetical protein